MCLHGAPISVLTGIEIANELGPPRDWISSEVLWDILNIGGFMKTNKIFILTGAAFLMTLPFFPKTAFAKKICPEPAPIKRSGTISLAQSPTMTQTGTVRMVQQCYFDMPIYDQTNPNFAYVSVPDSTYCAEKNPILQNYFGDQGTCDNGLPRVPDSPVPPSKSFYKTWLPWGPLAGDPDSPGYAGSATCAANSGAMVVHALVNNKDASTTLVQGTGDVKSWIHDVFLTASKPAEQENWPDPLVTYSSNNTTYVSTYGDQNAARRDPYRMTATDLQQVVNMGSYLGTDPTYMTETFWNWFDFYENFQPMAQTFYTQQTSVETFRNYLKQGYTGIIGIGPVTVHVVNSRDGTEKITLEPGSGGHIMAIQGFSSIADYKATTCNYNPITGKTHCNYELVPGTESFNLSINDPWFANRRTVPITTLKAGTNERSVRGGTQVREVDFGLTDEGTPNYTGDDHATPATEIALWPFDTTNTLAPLDVWSLTDGQVIYVIGITDLMLVS